MCVRVRVCCSFSSGWSDKFLELSRNLLTSNIFNKLLILFQVCLKLLFSLLAVLTSIFHFKCHFLCWFSVAKISLFSLSTGNQLPSFKMRMSSWPVCVPSWSTFPLHVWDHFLWISILPKTLKTTLTFPSVITITVTVSIENPVERSPLDQSPGTADILLIYYLCCQ